MAKRRLAQRASRRDSGRGSWAMNLTPPNQMKRETETMRKRMKRLMVGIFSGIFMVPLLLGSGWVQDGFTWVQAGFRVGSSEVRTQKCEQAPLLDPKQPSKPLYLDVLGPIRS